MDTPPTTITNKNFLLQVNINRKNLNCLVKIAISYSVGRWEWVHLFPQNLWKESRKNPQDQFPFFPKFWWGCCVIVGGNQQRTGSGKKKREKWWAFLQWKKLNSEGRNQNWYITQWKKESSSVSYYWGLKRRELFHLSPLFVGHFSFFKYFSFIADRWRCGRVDVSVPYSVLLCAIVRLFYLTLLCPRLKLGCRQVFKCYCLTR